MQFSNFHSSKQPQTPASFSEVGADMAKGAHLLDVRSNAEYDYGHIEGAECFPLQDMYAGDMPRIDHSTKLYVYCQSGNRSAQAMTLLQQSGFSDVIDLGGMQDVVNLGGKITSS